MKMRADAGTENVDVASVQAFLRKGGNDAFAGDKSFQYGRPTANQRIESFWAQLMKSWTRWWRSYFAEMVDQGHLDTGNMLHRVTLTFSFLPIIRQELDQQCREWNSHRIRFQKNSDVPAGIPNLLYLVP
ncbi:PREDICTED: uncharacterized protein LOC106806127 isoform X1 [Priapulus caudatus]|uniref:Uncharacterized protein LOC106806127 isoform X1 n=1 Tax=Priapulus caudatus TaxID=37621 RepID=A0ABM1DU45_PRICU|nr:PREDICTED: uncharacterized protein LOC106806127 isoform X1 [Priapulus caudatus]